VRVTAIHHAAFIGVRAIELGFWVAGPAVAGVLADCGADVIKIEALQGDPMRRLFGALSGSKESRCPPFDLYNRANVVWQSTSTPRKGCRS